MGKVTKYDRGGRQIVLKFCPAPGENLSQEPGCATQGTRGDTVGRARLCLTILLFYDILMNLFLDKDSFSPFLCHLPFQPGNQLWAFAPSPFPSPGSPAQNLRSWSIPLALLSPFYRGGH